MLHERDLPEQEWHRLKGEFMPLLPPSGARVVVVEDDKGNIVGWWVIMTCVHLEPVWVDPRYRGNASMWRKLWSGVKSILIDAGVQQAVAVVMRDNPATHAISRLGFRPVNGDLYLARTGDTISYDRSA
jgi:hypothetical protein